MTWGLGWGLVLTGRGSHVANLGSITICMAHSPAGNRWHTQRGLTKTNVMEGAAHTGTGRGRELDEEPESRQTWKTVTSPTLKRGRLGEPLRADATGEAGPGAVPAMSFAHRQNPITPLCSSPETGWDLGPFAIRLTPGHTFPRAKKYKETTAD